MEAKKVLDETAERLLAFVDAHGGPSEVARHLQIKPSMFYNFEAGRSKPSSGTLMQMAAAYPDFDLDYIMMGRTRVVTPAPHAVPVNLAGAELENAALKKQIHDLEQDKAKLWAIVLKSTGVQGELNFLRTSSQSTVHSTQLKSKRRFTVGVVTPSFTEATPFVGSWK